MKFIDKLERKFGNRGIENLTIYIIVSYVLGYALKTIVGILITMVITARTFMTMFRLLEITDAKVPIILLRIPL